MTDHLSTSAIAGQPVLFKFKRLRWLLPWLGFACVFFVPISGSLLSVWPRRHESTFDSIYVFTLSLILCFVGLVYTIVILDSADIILDERGVSRRLFSTTWTTMRWENVRLITAAPALGGYRQPVRAYNLFPKVKPWFRFLGSGKTMFTDRVDDPPQLAELLTLYASKHGIEITSNELRPRR
jgi:hypothetical protein